MRKREATCTQKKFISLAFFLILWYPVPLSLAATNLPQFRVVAQEKTALTILVPQATSQAQLQTLIREFRSARKDNTLSKLIPATTKNGHLGDYAIVWILVFSESDWASAGKLQRFIKSSMKSASDKQFDKEYVKHIKAEYYHSMLESYGNLGFDDGTVRSRHFKKLF